MYTNKSSPRHASVLLPLEQPLRRAPLTGALCKSALTRAFRPTFSFCMALRASLTELTTFTMLIWLSDSSCSTEEGKGRSHTDVELPQSKVIQIATFYVSKINEQ